MAGLIMIAFLIGCEDDSSEPISSQTSEEPDYYPIEADMELTYAFDSVVYDPFAETTDTIEGKIRRAYMEWGDDTSAENNTYRVEQYWKRDGEDDWKPHSQELITRLQEHLIVQKEGRRFAYMQEPIKVGNTWDGHSFNSMEEQEYRYTKVGGSFSTPDATYDNAVVVQMKNDTSFLFEIRQKMAFQEDVGMIYYLDQDEEHQTDHSEGYIYRQWLISE